MLMRAQQQLAAMRDEEAALGARCAELEQGLAEAQETAQAEGVAAAEAREEAAEAREQAADVVTSKAAAEQQAQRLQQQLGIAEAQVWRTRGKVQGVARMPPAFLPAPRHLRLGMALPFKVLAMLALTLLGRCANFSTPCGWSRPLTWMQAR